MKARRKIPWLAAYLLGAVLPTAEGYVLSGDRWPAGQPIVMSLDLGNPDGTLLDGSTSWDQVAEAALDVWNSYLSDNMQFVAGTPVTPARHDGKNSVFFSGKIYGEAFGDDTLAVTLSTSDNDTRLKSEADVVVNTAPSFDSYRGLLREEKGDYVYDLRRVLIHEFGHVLGLHHVSQNARSIMTPDVSYIDTIQSDDIAGVEAIYGEPNALPGIISPGNASGTVGNYFHYETSADNSPTSYAASGLPDGLSIDTVTGVISGTPTAAGTFHVTLSATNANGTATATLELTFAILPVITSPLRVRAVVGQPFVYRITADNSPASYTVNNTSDGLTFDPDTGLITGVPASTGILSIGINARNAAGEASAFLYIAVLNDLAVTDLCDFQSYPYGQQPNAPLVQTADGSLCGTTRLDGPSGGGTVFKLAADGTLTTLRGFSEGEGFFPRSGLLLAADGSLYGTTSLGGFTYNGTVFKLAPDGTYTTLDVFPPDAGVQPLASLTQVVDGSIYGTTSHTSYGSPTGGTIFKIAADGTLTTPHTFTGADGTNPSRLVQATDGNFYGTTASGGDHDSGTFFRLALDGTFVTILSFSDGLGGSPTSLIQAGDGNFYGAFGSGDPTHPGVIFRVTADGAFSVVHAFGNGEGTGPSALCRGRDGALYGATTGTGDGSTLFKVTTDGVLTTLHRFGHAENQPSGELVQGADGEFYGATANGGFNQDGMIFKTTLNAVPIVPPVVSLAATTPRVSVSSGGSGAFTVSLSAPQVTPVIVYYTVKGSAANGTDYVRLKGKKKIKPGKMSKVIHVIPQGDLDGASRKVVKLVLQPDPNYTVGTPLPAKVKLLGSSSGGTE